MVIGLWIDNTVRFFSTTCFWPTSLRHLSISYAWIHEVSAQSVLLPTSNPSRPTDGSETNWFKQVTKFIKTAKVWIDLHYPPPSTELARIQWTVAILPQCPPSDCLLISISVFAPCSDLSYRYFHIVCSSVQNQLQKRFFNIYL